VRVLVKNRRYTHNRVLSVNGDYNGWFRYLNSNRIDHPVGGVSMQSRSRHISDLTLALAVAAALISPCPAQEVALLDLTKVAARVELQRPKATSPVKGGYSGTQETSPCFRPNTGRRFEYLLVSLDAPIIKSRITTFEVRWTNAGHTIEIRFAETWASFLSAAVFRPSLVKLLLGAAIRPVQRPSSSPGSNFLCGQVEIRAAATARARVRSLM